MGSWNETCALTQLPIRAGAPVVALTTIRGPKFRSEAQNSDTSLLFGLPLEAEYDDYGGIEALVNPALQKFTNTAFDRTGFYKKWELKKEYGDTEASWVACQRDTLWALEAKIKPLFYTELGVRLHDLDSSAKESYEKTLKAFHMAQASLEQLGDLLASAQLGETVKEAKDRLFCHVESVFGKERAWPAWQILSAEGLFARKDYILMHKAAYNKVVEEFGKRKVGYYGERKKASVREFLADTLDEWLWEYQTEFEKWSKRAEAAKHGGISSLVENFSTTRRISHYSKSAQYLKPITTLWLAPDLPLVGHFWGGATPAEVLAVESKEQIVDYLVFQWARHYLRLDFVKGSGGSQNEEVVLSAEMFKATLNTLKGQNLIKRDFSGCLYR